VERAAQPGRAARRCDAFLNVQNQRGAAFYLSHGFKRGQGAQVYVLPATSLPALDEPPADRFTPQCVDGLRALHSLAFPDSPLTIEAFLDPNDDDRRLFVCGDNRRCLGYVAASINDSPREGYIDLLAVDAAVRNQGYGRRLLLTAAHWLIVEKGHAAGRLDRARHARRRPPPLSAQRLSIALHRRRLLARQRDGAPRRPAAIAFQ
jgi:GNAT superfamily N-acetyltransferase